MTAVEVVEAGLGDKPVLQRLVELYMHDFSEYTQRDVDEHGAFGYRYLDHYWTEPDRHPFLLRHDGHWCGFALIRRGDTNAVAEFFILRKYRRRGLGTQAASDLLNRFPGEWEVEQVAGNVAAREFWRRVIPPDFSETRTDEGWRQTFTVRTKRS